MRQGTPATSAGGHFADFEQVTGVPGYSTDSVTSVGDIGPVGAGINALRLQTSRAPSSDRPAAGPVAPRKSGSSARRPGIPEPSGSGSVHSGDRSTESQGFKAPEALDPKTGDPLGSKIRDLLYAGGILMEARQKTSRKKFAFVARNAHFERRRPP